MRNHLVVLHLKKAFVPFTFMKHAQMLQPHQPVLLDQAIEIDHYIAAHVHPLAGNRMIND